MFFPIILSILFPFLDETVYMPAPTKEINVLINQLGNDRWRDRESATFKLKEIGWPALKGVYKAAKSSNDPEIQMRASSIYRSYFDLVSDNKEVPIPPIWYMDEKLRYPDGFKLEVTKIERLGSCCKILEIKDIATEYFRLALKNYEELDQNNIEWSNETVAISAMNCYIKTRLLRGEKHADLKKILNHAVKNQKEYSHYYQTGDITNEWPAYDWTQLPPGPMIRKEDFKEPNSWGP